MKRVSNRLAFMAWLNRAAKGEACTYWLGHLTIDRWAGDKDAQELGGETWRSYKAGLVVLVQKRLDKDLYRYMAIKK